MIETKVCSGRYGCGEELWIEEFRVLVTGSRATYCRHCEREFDRFRKGHNSVFDPLEIPSGLAAQYVPAIADRSPSAEAVVEAREALQEWTSHRLSRVTREALQEIAVELRTAA